MIESYFTSKLGAGSEFISQLKAEIKDMTELLPRLVLSVSRLSHDAGTLTNLWQKISNNEQLQMLDDLFERLKEHDSMDEFGFVLANFVKESHNRLISTHQRDTGTRKMETLLFKALQGIMNSAS